MTSRVVLPGVVLGAIVLALFAGLAIGLPKLVDDPGTGHGSTAPITLPDTLPGGFTASDLEAAFASLPEDQQDQIGAAVRNEQAAREYADSALQATGVSAASRTYVASPEDENAQVVIVQAFRAAGGAFAPFQITDPTAAQAGSSVNTLVTKGGVTCSETGAADGSGGIQAQYVECQKSSADFTLQLTTQLPLDDAIDLVDTVWSKVA